MRNFLLTLRSALFFILLFSTVQLVSAQDFEVDGLYYRVQNSSLLHVAVVGIDYSNQEGEDEWWTDEFIDVVIPETVTYNGKVYTVVYIGNEAFASSRIKSIYIPNTVLGIGTGAFRECWGLTSVTIPTSVSSLGESAFESCGLTEVTVPSSITTLREAVFRNCYELTSIHLFNSTISSHMFEGCYGLEEVIIPDNITYIGSYAFSGCYGLTSITIPEAITSIGAHTFEDCMELTSITIPEAVTSIGSYAFSGCSGLTSITLPEAVTSIGSYAFSGCSGLTSITIPEAVTSIDSYAFSGCSGLTSITIPEAVTSIGSYAFSGCYELTSVTIHEGVTSFGERAFEFCSKLTDVTIPLSVTNIGEYAFLDCGLTSVTIPVSVKSIGKGSFNGCWQLKTVYFNAVNCSDLYDPDYDEIPFGESIEEFIIGENVKHIPAYLVQDCSITNVTIPESVTSIGEGAFSCCEQLKTVRFNATNCEDISSNSSIAVH